jgi:hypothetical protein
VFAAEGPRGKEVGRVRVVSGDQGLAVLRLGPALAASQGGPQLVAVGEGGAEVGVAPWRPDWWPSAWGAEEGRA